MSHMKVIMVEEERKTRQDTTGTRTFKIKQHVFRLHQQTLRHRPSGLQLLPLAPACRLLPFYRSPGLTSPVWVCNRNASAEPRSVEEEGDMTGSCFLSRRRCDVLMWNMTPGASLPLCTPPIISHRVQSCPAMASISCFLSAHLAGTWFPTVTQQESGGRRRASVAGSIVEKKITSCCSSRWRHEGHEQLEPSEGHLDLRRPGEADL